MSFLATLSLVFALADTSPSGMEVAEALPLTDLILMIHLK